MEESRTLDDGVSKEHSYGAAESLVRQHHQHRPHVCGLGGPDAPALLLLWLLLAQVLLPTALVPEVAVAALAAALSVSLALGLLWLSRNDGWPWRLFCLLLLLASSAGLGAGFWLRAKGTVAEAVVQGAPTLLVRPRALCQCLFALAALLLMLLLLSWLLPLACRDLRLRGSSARYGDPEYVNEPGHRSLEMQFGCPCGPDLTMTQLLAQDDSHYAEQLMSHLLDGDCFWSGEPVFDYVFHMANEHLVWGCIFCHPAHPFEKSKRIFQLANVALLIVFPVAAFTVCWGEGMVRILLQFLVVTVPRTLFRFLLKKTGTMEGEIVLHRAVDRAQIRQAQAIAGRSQNNGRGHLKRADTTDLYLNESGVWRHQLTDEELAALASARRWEAAFFVGSSLATLATCLVCILIIRAHHVPLAVSLMESSNGLLYAFYMDSIVDLFGPRCGKDEALCVGFFHQWLVERQQEASHKTEQWVTKASTERLARSRCGEQQQPEKALRSGRLSSYIP